LPHCAQTLAVDIRIVPGRTIQTQDSLRSLTGGVFKAGVASNDNQRVVNCPFGTQCSV